MFVRTSGRRMHPAIIHVEHERKDHVSIAGEPNRAFELLPVRHLEPAVVEAGMKNIVFRSQLGQEIKCAASEAEAITLSDPAEQMHVTQCPAGRPWSDEAVSICHRA